MDCCETSYEHIKGGSTFTIYAGEQWSINMVLYAAEQYPDRCQIIRENRDGSLVAHVDFKLFPKIKKPRNITEEQRQRSSDRMKQMAREKYSDHNYHDLE